VAIALLSMPVPEPWGGEVGAGLCGVVVPARGQQREGGRGHPNPSLGNAGSHPLGSSKSWLRDVGLTCPYQSD